MRRLSEAAGGGLEWGGRVHRAFPEAQQLLAAPPGTMLTATNNTRKTERMDALVRAWAGADELFLRRAPYDEVARWLRNIKGVGAWSIDFIMLRGLGRAERVPWTDTGLLPATSAYIYPGSHHQRGGRAGARRTLRLVRRALGALSQGVSLGKTQTSFVKFASL